MPLKRLAHVILHEFIATSQHEMVRVARGCEAEGAKSAIGNTSFAHHLGSLQREFGFFVSSCHWVYTFQPDVSTETDV